MLVAAPESEDDASNAELAGRDERGRRSVVRK
jgi:hypothetical protein